MDPQSRFGKYQLLELLGTGGMGAVYKAVDPHIGRTVALKLLAPGMQQNAELRERFLREARAAGRLQHPNIVVIHDLGEEAGELYIAMEFLEGETLAEQLKQRRSLPVPEAVEVMAQVAKGLHYAHERGVVHRDVKPHNIMITRDGLAKIVDFGIARAGDQRLTKTGQVMGTVFYMSPEQINGRPLDGRSDVFSAGVVLYEMLTGRVPFEGESTGATMMKIIMEPTPPLRMLAPLSPPELEKVVMTALAKQPDERYASAAAFAKALEGVRRTFSTGAHTAARGHFAESGFGVPTAPYPVSPTGGVAAAATSPSVTSDFDSPSPRTQPEPAPSRWWRSSTLKYAFPVFLAVLLGGGWWMLRPATHGGDASASISQGTTPSPTVSVSPQHPVPVTPAPELDGTYDLYRDNVIAGEMTVFNQKESEFAVRAKEWDAQGHINGREGYYDWRFAGGTLAGETGRTSFTVQKDGALVGKVQGDRPELKWAFLAKPRKGPAEPLGPAAAEPVPSELAWMDGTWVGVAHQQQTKTDWSIRLVVKGNSYKIEYPSLDCNGSLTPTKLAGSYAVFAEHITGGAGTCIDGGIITLVNVSNGRIQYRVDAAADIGFATLKRE